MSDPSLTSSPTSTRPWRQSIVAQLRLSFGCLAALTVIACVSAVLRLDDASSVAERLTVYSIPSVKLSLLLESRTAAVLRAMSDISTAENERQRATFKGSLDRALSAFRSSLSDLKNLGSETASLSQLTALSNQIDNRIIELDSAVADKLRKQELRRTGVEAVANATLEVTKSLGVIGDGVLMKLRDVGKADPGSDASAADVVTTNLPALQAVYDMRTSILGVENILNKASSISDQTEIVNLGNQFDSLYRSIVGNLDVVIANPYTDPARETELSETVRRLLAVGVGGNSLFNTRIDEVAATAAALQVREKAREIGDQLGKVANDIVADSETQAIATNRLLSSDIYSSIWVLVLIAGVTVVVALLIGRYFIEKNVVKPVGNISRTMLQLAHGDLDVPLPEVTADELGDMSKALVVFRNNARDIREARDAAEKARIEAESASRTKSAFLANMSHELRTPLNAIIGYSEMMIEDFEEDGDAAGAKDLVKIRSAGKHLLQLINDILDLSKIEAGKMELYVEKISAPALLQEVRTLAEPLAAVNGNTLSVEVADDVGEIETDLVKLKQSLLNLVSNACKFTKNGAVSVRAVRQTGVLGDEVRFSISDNGIGMTDEQLSKLFQPFVQADSSTTRQFGGTGLGLAITKQFCRMLSGDVLVESAQGKGSVFTLVLPVSRVAPQQAPTEASGDSTGVEGATTILLVDDDKDVHDLVGSMLTREGYRVLHATNGVEAVTRARSDRPAAILLDIMMPKIDGWTVLSELKADAELRNIPVVIHSMLDERPRSISRGAAEFISKPVERTKLISVIERYAGSAKGVALIVDDQEADRAYLSQALRSIGMTVESVADGAAALEWLRVNPRPAAILLDIMMPELDGFSVLTALRDDHSLTDVPVIILTAKELTVDESQFLRDRGGIVIAKGPDARATVLGALRQVTG